MACAAYAGTEAEAIGVEDEPDAVQMASPTRGLEVLVSAAVASDQVNDGEDEVELCEGAEDEALPPVASAYVESVPHAPLSAYDQTHIIARQQHEIAALREVVAKQGAMIEQLRHAACRVPGTSPPPLYGPSSPSTELAGSEELDELSPSREAAREGSGQVRNLPQPLHYPQASLMGAHAAAASLGALSASYDPRLGAFSAPCDARPASAASTLPPSVRGPPTPSRQLSNGKLPRTPSSRQSPSGEGHAPKRMRAGDGSCAPSPAHALPFSAVTLSLPPFKTTITAPVGGAALPKNRIGGGRTNTHVLWTPEEDTCLRALVQEHGEQAWALVASRMPHERNNKQCRERWRNHLRPACNKGPWTEEEDRLILERVQQHGTKWAKISGLYLPDRPENDIKNRWHILIRLHQQPGAPTLPHSYSDVPMLAAP